MSKKYCASTKVAGLEGRSFWLEACLLNVGKVREGATREIACHKDMPGATARHDLKGPSTESQLGVRDGSCCRMTFAQSDFWNESRGKIAQCSASCSKQQYLPNTASCSPTSHSRPCTCSDADTCNAASCTGHRFSHYRPQTWCLQSFQEPVHFQPTLPVLREY